MNSYTTQYKKEQKDVNLPNGIKFILDFVNKEFDKIEDKDIKITSEILKDKYKLYCADIGIKYHINTLNTQIRKIGIPEPKQVNFKGENGISKKKFCYKINSWKLQEEMRRFLQDDNYLLNKNDDNIEECDNNELYKEKSIYDDNDDEINRLL